MAGFNIWYGVALFIFAIIIAYLFFCRNESDGRTGLYTILALLVMFLFVVFGTISADKPVNGVFDVISIVEINEGCYNFSYATGNEIVSVKNFPDGNRDHVVVGDRNEFIVSGWDRMLCLTEDYIFNKKQNVEIEDDCICDGEYKVIDVVKNNDGTYSFSVVKNKFKTIRIKNFSTESDACFVKIGDSDLYIVSDEQATLFLSEDTALKLLTENS